MGESLLTQSAESGLAGLMRMLRDLFCIRFSSVCPLGARLHGGRKLLGFMGLFRDFPTQEGVPLGNLGPPLPDSAFTSIPGRGC